MPGGVQRMYDTITPVPQNTAPAFFGPADLPSPSVPSTPRPTPSRASREPATPSSMRKLSRTPVSPLKNGEVGGRPTRYCRTVSTSTGMILQLFTRYQVYVNVNALCFAVDGMVPVRRCRTGMGLITGTYHTLLLLSKLLFFVPCSIPSVFFPYFSSSLLSYVPMVTQIWGRRAGTPPPSSLQGVPSILSREEFSFPSPRAYTRGELCIHTPSVYSSYKYLGAFCHFPHKKILLGQDSNSRP